MVISLSLIECVHLTFSHIIIIFHTKRIIFLELFPVSFLRKGELDWPSVITSDSAANLVVMRTAAAESSRMLEVIDCLSACGWGVETAMTILRLLLEGYQLVSSPAMVSSH